MADRDVRTVLDGMSYLECPRWHDGRVYVSDFYTRRVLALDLDGDGAAGGVDVVATVPEQPSGIGWMPDGTMLVVSMRDRPCCAFAMAASPNRTPTCRSWRRGTSTTWSSTARAVLTSATSASTSCPASRSSAPS